MFPVDERVSRPVQQPQSPRGQIADQEHHVPRGQGFDFGIVARKSITGRTGGIGNTEKAAGAKTVDAYFIIISVHGNLLLFYFDHFYFLSLLLHILICK